MTILAYDDLVRLVQDGVISGVLPGAINGTSIDVHLGSSFLQECPHIEPLKVDLSKRENPTFTTWNLPAGYTIDLTPGQFMLASTVEIFHLPNDISAQFLLKSSVARAGLSHALATWADPGWHSSSLTLELHNLLRYHSLRLAVGMPIGQMIFHRHAAVPDHASYATRGRYNEDHNTTAQKP